MKTIYKLKPGTNLDDFADFAAIEGTWSICSQNAEAADLDFAEKEIAADLERNNCFPVVVQLFRGNGCAIVDEPPKEGTFVATRSFQKEKYGKTRR